MGLFAKLKEKKEKKQRHSDFCEFIYGQHWLFGWNNRAWGSGLFNPMEDNPDSWGMEGLVKTITDWDFYKEIKSAEEEGEKPGDGYIKVFNAWSSKVRGLSYEHIDLPDGSIFFRSNKHIFDESWDNLLSLFAMILKIDSDYWYGKDYEGERNAYPYLDVFEATHGESNRILLASLVLDPQGTFDGTAPYARFLKAILKSYSAHKGAAWHRTIENLFYSEKGEELTADGKGKVSILAAVYNYTSEFDESKHRYVPATDRFNHGPIYDAYQHRDIEKGETDLSGDAEAAIHHKPYLQTGCVTSSLNEDYNGSIAAYAASVIDAAINKILLSDEYWADPENTMIWDFLNSVKEKAYIDGNNTYCIMEREEREKWKAAGSSFRPSGLRRTDDENR